jgi:hypothetical protein
MYGQKTTDHIKSIRKSVAEIKPVIKFYHTLMLFNVAVRDGVFIFRKALKVVLKIIVVDPRFLHRKYKLV